MSRASLFKPFEEIKVPLKLLVYGDPGTEKTRRALQMPRPLYVIDMENGASCYARMVEPGQGFYLATKSHAELIEALDELLAMPPGEVGTLVIDPITVAWQSLMNGHIERVCQKKGSQPEDVHFDVGAWGKLKRVYGDLMTRILNAPFHVVMTARGKEKIDERGNAIGYGYEGEKSTMFLANVVIESHGQHDVVIKDRTGTYKEAAKRPRVQFTEFLPQTGTAVVKMETDSDAAEKDAYESDWRRFGQQVRSLGLTVDEVSAWCLSKGWKRPSTANPSERQRLLKILASEATQAELRAFLDPEGDPLGLKGASAPSGGANKPGEPVFRRAG